MEHPFTITRGATWHYWYCDICGDHDADLTSREDLAAAHTRATGHPARFGKQQHSAAEPLRTEAGQADAC